MSRAGRTGWRQWTALLAIPLIWAGGSAFGWIGFLDTRVEEWLLRFRGEIESPIKLVYVDVDSEATETFGASLNRGIFAGLAEGLLELGGARGVGIDFIFSEYGPGSEPRGNRELRRVVEKFPGRIVLAASYATGLGTVNEKRVFPFRGDGFRDPMENDLPELPEFAATGLGARIGLIDVLEGERRGMAPLFVEARGVRYLHMGLQLALLHWGVDAEAVEIDPEFWAVEIRSAEGELLRRIPLIEEQLLEVNWHSRWISPENPRWSALEVAYYLGRMRRGSEEERREASAFFEQFRNAVILIGPVEAGLGDRAPTPLDREPTPKVGILGNLAKTIAGGNFVKRPGVGAEFGLTFLLGAMAIPAIGFSGKRGRRFAVLAAAVWTVYLGGAVFLFSEMHWVLPVAGPVLAGISTVGIGLAGRLREAEKQRKRIQGMFGSYVAPEMVRSLVAADREPELGGEEVEITAFFSDVERFSTFAEKVPARELVSLMNEYLSAMTEIVLEEKGTLDKYIGDAVAAFFGSPVRMEDHARRACRAAARIQERQRELCEKWRRENPDWPTEILGMRTRIGLNTGRAVVGNIGSRQRFNYTMMGDSVNLAARIEQLGKTLGSCLLVTGETRRQAEADGADFLFRYLGRIAVKGRTEEAEVHELMGFRKRVSEAGRECVRIFEEGMALFEAGRMAEAGEFFERSAELEPEGRERRTPSRYYLERCGEG